MKKKLNKYSFGGFLKQVGNGVLDTGRLTADWGLSMVGLPDVIDNDSYSTDFGRRASRITDKIAPIAGQAVAGAFLGPAGVAAVQGIQNIGKGINGNPQGDQLALTQQREQREELLRQQRMGSSQVLNNVPTQGVSGSGYYEDGGPIPTRRKATTLTKPNIEAETTSTRVDRRLMDMNEARPEQTLNSNFLRRQIPDALEMFVDHGILGRKNPVESVDPEVENVFRDIAKRKNIKDGKSKNVTYTDYIPNYRPGRDAAGLSKYTDPSWNAANIIGNGRMEREGKDVVIRDTYDFNHPAFPDDTGMLPRIKSYMLNDNPQPGLPPEIANSMKQKAERYFGRKKGSDVNMRIKDVYAMGGELNSQYEVEKGEVVQGHDVELEEGTQHASDIHEVGGEKHSEGGTEGQGGERVFSDRLKPAGMRESYAELATKLGKDKGRMEKKAASMNEFARNTGSRMSSRVDRVLDELFAHQEATKPRIAPSQQFAMGGPLDWQDMGKNTELQRQMQAAGFYKDKIDGVWGPNSEKAYAQYKPNNFASNWMQSQSAAVNNPGSFLQRTAQPALSQPMTTDVGMKAAAPMPRAVPSTMSGEDTGMFDFGNAANSLAGVKKGFSSENMSKAAGVAGQIAPYLDNIANAFIEPARVQAPNLISAPQLNTQVDISADLAGLSTQGRVLNQSIDNSTANAQSARANKIAAFASGLSQTGQLYQTKRREEASLMNQQAGLNAQADSTNAGLKNAYNTARTAREDNRLSMISANAANAAMDAQGQMRDDKMYKNDIEKFSLINKRFNASGVVDRKLLTNLLSMYGGSVEKAAAARGETVDEFTKVLAASK